MLHLKIAKDGKYKVYLNNRPRLFLGLVKDQESFDELLKKEARLMTEGDRQSYSSQFAQVIYRLGMMISIGVKVEGIGIFSDREAENICRQLEEATRKAFQELDEFQRKSWVDAQHMIIGATAATR